MTSVDVNDVLKRTQSTANGSTTDFSFSFQVNATSEIKVYEDSTLKTEGTHYDIVDSSASAGLNANGTGVVKFKTSPTDYTPANNKVITILSVMSLARSSVYSSGGNITAGSLETDFDRLHRIAGDFKEVKSRTLIAPEYSATNVDMTIPSKADRLGKILGFNSSTGNPEMYVYLTNENTVALDGLTAGTVTASKYVLVDANKDIGTFRNVTLSGALTSASLDIGSGGADIDGALEANSITVAGTALNEYIADTVGAMVGSNTETGVTVSYEDGDNTLDFALGASQTTITSLLATDIKIGEDDQTKIDFETADTINFYAGNEKQLILTDGALTPGSNAIVDLGTDALEFKDAYFDGTVEADAYTVEGVALNEYIADTVGAMVGSNTETGISVTYDDADNTLDFVIGTDSITGTMLNDDIISGQTAITSGLASTDELLFSDAGTIKRMDVSVLTDYYKSLEVTETNKTLTSPKINEDVALTSTATELNLLDGVSGLVQADFTKLAEVDSTSTELNIVDGNTSVGTTAVASGDGIVTNDGGTMRQTNVDTFDTYLSQTTKTLTNKTLTNPTLTSPVLNTGVSGTAILDEDDMSTDSATQLATQQSIKAYVDAQTLSLIDEDNMATDSASRPPSQQSVKAYIATQIATKDNSDEITEGSSNLYFTNARADARITNALIDEDDMSTNSATKIPSQQSVKAYVDAQKADMQFVLEDGDGTEVQITKDKEVKFVEGGGIDINWTDTDNGTDGDPFDLTFTINADQTDITSLLATDIKIGEDDQTKIDFETANQINFYADNTKRVTIDSTGLTVNSGSLETATIDYTDGDNAMTIADGGAVTFAQVPVFPDDTIETNDIQDNAVTLAKMAGLARGKLITGDSSGDPTALAIGTNGQYLKSDGNDLVWGSATISGLACDDLTVGDSAVTLSTSSGNITIDAQGNDTDIIFKGTDSDGSGDITMLTLDGSNAGTATFNGNIIIPNAGNIGSVSDTDAIAIASNGEVTLSQKLIASSGADFTGTVTGTVMTKLSSVTVTSDVANVTFSSSLITDTYMDYRITYRAVTPASNAQKFFAYCSIDNGSNYNLPIEQHLMYHDLKSSKAFGNASTTNSVNYFDLNSSIHSSTSKGSNGTIEFIGLRQDTASFKGAYWNSVAGISSDSGHDSGNDYWWNGGGKVITASKINNIKLAYASGDIAQGTFTLYGIKA